MGFMNKVRDALARFLYGRNGIDQLCWAMVIAELALSLIGGLIPVAAERRIFSIVTTVLTVLVFWRVLSKDLYRRREENARFRRWWGPIAQRLRGGAARRADKEHKYVKCACGTMCRVPKGVGRVEMTCPKCGKKTIVRT